MMIPLRVLILEDNLSDAELVLYELHHAGYDPQWQRVEDEAGFLSALESMPDLILADYRLPQFDGLRALLWVKERQLDIPFIIISGTIGEETAVEAIKHGAVDYLLKDRLARLGQAVAQALEQKRLRTEKRQAEEALRASEERFHSLFDNSTIGLYRTTPEGVILLANPTLIRMLGFSSIDELAQRDLEQEGYAPQYARSSFRQTIEREGEVTGLEASWSRKDGSSIFVRESAKAIRSPDGNVLYYEGTVEDITERKQAEEALRQAENKYRTLVEQIAAVTYIDPIGTSGSSSFISPQIEKLSGYSTQDWLAQTKFWATVIHPEDRLRVTIENRRSRETGDPFRIEYRLLARDDRVVWVRDEALLLRDAAGQPVCWQGVMIDISELKQAEQHIKASLAEKEVLLKEIHHRVKNNLAIVSSLLEMQARRSPDEQVRNEFRVSQQRILAMAQIHEQLYRSQNLAQIGMADYVSALAKGLLSMDILSDVAMKVDIQDVQLDIDQAVPCGLIINELLTNALKYAFSPARLTGAAADQPRKEILVSMQLKNGSYVLQVSDNGAGLPGEMDVKNTHTLGLRLVNRLTAQLDGDLQVASSAEGGVVITITFPAQG